MPHNREIRILTNISDIEAMREVWTSFGGHRDSDIDVYLSILRWEGGSPEPYVPVLYRDGNPETILIGKKGIQTVSVRIGYWTLWSPRLRAITFVYGALRGNQSTENCRDLLRVAYSSLASHEVDMICFPPVEIESPLHEAIRREPGIFTRDVFLRVAPHWFMEILADARLRDVLLERERKRRKKVEKKFTAAFNGDIKIASLSRPEDLDRLFFDAEQVARTTYQRGLGVGFSGDREIIRHFLRLQAERGWLRACILYAAQTPCAFATGCVYDHTFYCDYVGFDRAYAAYSPGSILLLKMVEMLMAEGVERIDYGMGDAGYKKRLATRNLYEAPFNIFGHSFRAIVVNVIRTMAITADQALRYVVGRTGTLAKVKRLWRERIQRSRPSLRGV